MTTCTSAWDWAFVAVIAVELLGSMWITRNHSWIKEGSPMAQEFDLDAMVAQRREAVGGDDIVFTFGGEKFSFPHPLLATDEWKDQVAESGQADVDQVRAMLGEEQYERYHALGGQAGFVMLIVQQVQQSLRDETPEGRPTRPSTSSRPRRKR